MPDFSKLKARQPKAKVIEPEEIFRRLPKPPGINDLYQSQAEVLRAWYGRRDERDLVIKLHTGGGKTLVGLLIAQSTLNEKGEPVLYLTPTVQLMNQALAKAKEYGLPAVPYATGREPLPDAFTNGQAVLVATYNALFNGISKFGVSGTNDIPVVVGAILLDDAHASFSVIREQFTLTVDAKKEAGLFGQLATMFRGAFQQVERVGTFDDVVAGAEYGVLEVPYWAWADKRDAVREILKNRAEEYRYVWPFLRDRLGLCHAFVSSSGFTITPIVPPVDAIPTFAQAPRRIYMSATIADDSSIVRTFDAAAQAVEQPLMSKSLAGVSERMILVPELMPFKFDVVDFIKRVGKWVAQHKKGVVILVPSGPGAQAWQDCAALPASTKDVDTAVAELQAGVSYGPIILANRYDGIDLPGDACRLLIMSGLPKGTSAYELFRGSALVGGRSIVSALAQRIEQGIGRGARGAGDYCVVILLGHDLVGWIAKDANSRFLTASTRAQLEMGAEVSKAVTDLNDVSQTILKCLNRDKDWMEYHAGQLADLVEHEGAATDRIREASIERRAVSLFADGHPDKAIARITEFLDGPAMLDGQTRGWFEQLAARFTHMWGNHELAHQLQTSAYSHNRNLHRPLVAPPYQPIPEPGEQAQAIAAQLAGYRVRRGFLREFEETVSLLVPAASANQFEQALADLGQMLGFSTQRPENTGEPGSDVLWLLPGRVGIIIEAKSRKKQKNALTKQNHGQLLVSQLWFTSAYPGHSAVRVSMHPNIAATRDSVPVGVKALTYEKLQELIGDTRAMLSSLCESQVPPAQLGALAERFLQQSNLRSDRLVATYFVDFQLV